MTSIVIVQDLWTEISKGKIPGQVIDLLGIGVSAFPHGTLDNVVVWNQNTVYPDFPTVGKVSVDSTNVNDTAAGTGARTIILHGTDATNSKFITETIIMAGTTAVLSTQDFSSVNGLSRVVTAGSLGRTAGVVRGRMAGVTVLSMDQGFTEGSHAHFTVPLDTTAFLFGITYASRFRCELLTQNLNGISDAVYNDIDRTDVGGGRPFQFDLTRTPRKIDPNSRIRTVMRSPTYHNKIRVSWRLALIPTVAL